jgi:antitoxin (DNA-binding transcriptional repressor) of toxin-antitoxin stability system
VRVANGEKIIIARTGKPVAELVPLKNATKNRMPGMWKGRLQIPRSFFDPLPENELKRWEGQ